MSNPTSPALRRALLATLVLCMVGCKDLKIQTQGDADEFRFGEKNEMWLTYKKEVIEPGAAGFHVVWSSDKQGELSREVRLDLSNLRPGKHKITATCEHDKKKGKKAKKDKKIEILNDRPEPAISGVLASYGVGKTVSFTGSATDREDGAVPTSNLSWALDGPNGKQSLGAGETAEVSDLRPGIYILTLTATDRAGAAGQALKTFEITNQAPEVTISSSLSPAPINVLDSLQVAGSATDPDPVHGAATLTDLVWTSNLHPGQVLAQGASATLSNLKGGTHRITLTAKDEFGTPGSASFSLQVNNQDPTVQILSPSSNSFFSAADSVSFQAQASDPEAAIDPQNVVWSSSNGGFFARGLTVDTDKLKAGKQTITCTVTDAHGGSARDSIEILIRNELPQPVIVRPGPIGAKTWHYNDRIRLVGEATDEEDGTVADSGMVWSFRKLDGDKSGTTGKLRQEGASINVPAERLVERAGFGTFEITLTATDSDGGEATSQARRLRIENQRTEVRLQAPTLNATFTAGESIRLSAVATDPDSPGFLSGNQFRWAAKELSTGQVTPLGKGDSIQTDKLAAGRYEISVVVTDPQDESTTVRETTRIEVKPAPAPTPTAPTAGPDTAGIAPTVAGAGN
ncbi:MAG: hypothetical protein KDD82_10750 [Planctomycetes bacterium]|nr:hypothetical protein [Planctomycetota bacterium]